MTASPRDEAASGLGQDAAAWGEQYSGGGVRLEEAVQPIQDANVT